VNKGIGHKRVFYRPPTINDIGGLSRIEVTCFRSYYYRGHRFSERQFHYYLKNPLTIALVAEDGGTLVGYVLGIVQRGRLGHIARLYSIAVLPEARQRGVGSRLLREFMGEAGKRGAREVSLEVAEANKVARSLFSKAGFRKSGRLRDYYLRGYDGIRMRRSL
jgi:ribosomal protein S18 acetylase RimI-like enzyme